MMNPKRLILLALCTGAYMSASAWNAGDLRTDSIPSGSADTWTLQRCIDHALEQNIDIKMDRINAESAGIDEKTAKAAFLPSLNASIGQRIVNNPFSDTNTIIDGTYRVNEKGEYVADQALKQRIHEAVFNKNPLDGEMEILALYFDFLDENTPFDGFSLEALMIYALKMQIIERVRAFSQEKGRAEFRTLYGRIQEQFR